MQQQEERWHALATDRALEAAGVDPEQGLSMQEAAQRIVEVGYNELAAVRGPSALQQFVGQFNDLIVWILLAAALISGPFLGEWTDAIAIVIIVLLNGILGFVQEYRAGKALEALRELTAPIAEVLRDGRLHEIPARELAPGDVIVIELGDLIPADGRLISAHNLSVDQAVFTGEAAPARAPSWGKSPSWCRRSPLKRPRCSASWTASVGS